MAASMNEYLGGLWFDFQHGMYDFANDVQNLPSDKLRKKYLSLKDDERFKNKYVEEEPWLLHDHIRDPDKSLFLIEMGYSFTRRNPQSRTPFSFVFDLNLGQELDENLDSVTQLIYLLVKSNKIPLIFSEEIDKLMAVSLQSGNIVLYYLLKKYYLKEDNVLPFPAEVKIEPEKAMMYDLIDNGFIYIVAVWFNKYIESLDEKTYTSDYFRYKGLSLLEWAVKLNDQRAVKYLLEKTNSVNINLINARKIAKEQEQSSMIELLETSQSNPRVMRKNIRPNIRAKKITVSQPSSSPKPIGVSKSINEFVSIHAMIAEGGGGYNFDSVIKAGANPFEINEDGLDAFEYCVAENNQNAFNNLVNALQDAGLLNKNFYVSKGTKEYFNFYTTYNEIGILDRFLNPGKRQQLISRQIRKEEGGLVNASSLLNFITEYFINNKARYNHQLLIFFWKHLALPVYQRSNRKDQLKIIYFFKNLNINASFDKARIDYTSCKSNASTRAKPVQATSYTSWSNSKSSAPDAEKIKELLIQVKHLVILDEQHTMLGLNTGRWGLGYGVSTLNEKLAEIVRKADKVFSACPGKTLSEKAEHFIANESLSLELRHYHKLTELVSELKEIAAKRSRDYGAQEHVNKLSTLTVS